MGGQANGLGLFGHVVLFFGCVLAAVPAVGFVAGMILCDDCGWNPLAYLFMGAITALLTSINLGHMWTGPDTMTNIWPYAFPVGAVFYFLAVARMRLLDPRRPKR